MSRPRESFFIGRWGLLAAAVALAFASIGAGCGRHPSEEVVVYTSVDEPVATPILREFERQTGIRVTIVPDTEASKSVGLAERLRAEKSHPQADVFWANEVFNTINLAEDGTLGSYDSPSARGIPARFQDPSHRWAGEVLRARVIVRGAVPAGAPPVNGVEDLTNPFWKDRIAMASPTAGTTGGAVAALEVLWGRDKAEEWLRALHANGIKLVGGNSVVAEEVGRGTVWVGLTDNDDADAARDAGGKLEMILPDQSTFGTLTIPCTVSMVAGAPHVETARKLVDYLLSAAVERRLIELKFARSSVRPAAGGETVKSMPVDYREVAKLMPQVSRRARDLLEGRP